MGRLKPEPSSVERAGGSGVLPRDACSGEGRGGGPFGGLDEEGERERPERGGVGFQGKRGERKER